MIPPPGSAPAAHGPPAGDPPSYWAHPAALAQFPVAALAWMAVSPVAMLGLVTGAVQLVRRVGVSPRILRYEAWVGSAAGVCMAAFLGGALCWVTEGALGRGASFTPAPSTPPGWP